MEIEKNFLSLEFLLIFFIGFYCRVPEMICNLSRSAKASERELVTRSTYLPCVSHSFD